MTANIESLECSELCTSTLYVETNLFLLMTPKPGTGVIPLGFSSGSDSKESACHAGDPGSIPVSGRSPGEGNGKPLQYSCLENPKDREAWRAIVHEVAKSQT